MQIINYLAANGPWAWVIAGLVMLGLELVLPGGFLLWMGVAGIVTGFVTMAYPLAWPVQWVMFGAMSLVFILAWLRFSRGREKASDSPYLNRRADRFIGHEAVLDFPIEAGSGRLALGDTIWRISGPDLPAGRRVRVVAHEGAVLKVEPI